ncbi:MAG TPA: hypothetical protein VMV46_08135 [Thermoanaerobaculia bacterium]|nr:hypothetical protein [Thermoanaerobaculia bacterium]
MSKSKSRTGYPSSIARPSAFAVFLLPAVIAQSNIIGGGYATGRETVQYAARFGPAGWLAVLVIAIGFSLLCALAFELARLGRAYDYKRFIRLLIGPLWPLFDVVLIVLLLLVIAVMTAAIGSVLEQTVGLPYAIGLVIAFVFVGFLTWMGTEFIERFKSIGSVGLYAAYVAYAVVVLTRVPATPPPPDAPAFGQGEVLVSAVQYVGYNLGVIPVVLFCLHRQSRRIETYGSGVLAGVAMTIPFALTFACMMRFWPDEQVFGADVPWLHMLRTATGDAAPAWLWVFGVVAGWTLLETAVGGLHALVDRIEHNLGDLPASWRPAKGRLAPWQRTAIAVALLAVATGLANFGIIDLVAKGYGALAWGYILLLALPLLTVGVWRIAKGVAGAR